MLDIHAALKWLDVALMAAGGIVLLLALLRWRRRGWHDPLRGAPLRPNRLSALLVWLCFLTHLGGWVIGSRIAARLTPPGLQEDPAALRSWQSLVAANLTQVLVAITCLAVAHLAFRTGWHGLGLGRRPLRRDLADALAGLLVAFCVCNLLALAATHLIELLRPDYQYPDHSVFTMLESPSVTPMMRRLVLMGALVLAPVGEELFFRGILQTAARKLVPRRWGSLRHRWVAIGAAALLFGLMHLATPQHVVALAALAVILGYLYERTGSLAVPILLHMMFNGKSLLWYQLKQLFGAPL